MRSIYDVCSVWFCASIASAGGVLAGPRRCRGFPPRVFLSLRLSRCFSVCCFSLRCSRRPRTAGWANRWHLSRDVRCAAAMMLENNLQPRCATRLLLLHWCGQTVLSASADCGAMSFGMQPVIIKTLGVASCVRPPENQKGCDAGLPSSSKCCNGCPSATSVHADDGPCVTCGCVK